MICSVSRFGLKPMIERNSWVLEMKKLVYLKYARIPRETVTAVVIANFRREGLRDLMSRAT